MLHSDSIYGHPHRLLDFMYRATQTVQLDNVQQFINIKIQSDQQIQARSGQAGQGLECGVKKKERRRNVYY